MNTNTALLIIDIQNDYFDGGSNVLVEPLKACENAKLLLNLFRKKGSPIIHIQHIADRPNSTFFLPGTKGTEIHENVKPIEGEKIFVKHVPNSFYKTGLLEYLTSIEVTELVICGMMTHMCVDSSTRAARDFEFSNKLIGDACATKDLRVSGEIIKAIDVHNAFLSSLNGFYSQVLTTGEYLGS